MKNLKVLTYHEVDNPTVFQQQLHWLKKHYTIISLEELDHLRKNQTNFDGYLLITFDDGERSVYEKGLPLLKSFNLPAAIFIVVNYIGTLKPFWWQTVNYYFNSKPIQEKNNFIRQYKQASPAKREQLMEDVMSNSDLPEFKYKQLTLEELKELHANNITIANHTSNHYFLNELSADEQKNEIENAQAYLNGNGFYGDYLAYPNGFYNADTIKVLQNSSIKMSFLFDHKVNMDAADFNISRLSVDSGTPLWKFKFILSGWHSKLLKYRLMLKI